MGWREEAKGILPSGPAASFVSSVFGSEKTHEESSELGTGRNNSTGFGFGRQGEKTAGLKGGSPIPLFFFSTKDM